MKWFWKSFRVVQDLVKSIIEILMQNHNLIMKNKVKTENFKVFFIYALISWIICVKYVVEYVSLYLPSNHKFKGPCPLTKA
jgi:hypothetical protein